MGKEADTQSEEEKAAAAAEEATQAKALAEKAKGEKEEPTVTEAEVKARVEKAVQKAKIDAGRDNKAVEAKNEALKVREEAIAKEEKKRVEETREALRDDAEALKSFEAQEKVKAREKAVDDRDTELKARELELRSDKEAVDGESLINAIADVVTEFELDATKFTKSCTDLKLTTREQIESLARTLTGKEPDTTKKKPLATDSNRGGGTSADEEKRLKSRYPSMFKSK